MDTNYCLAELRAIPPDVDSTRTMEFVISNEKRDRHGTVLKLKGWDLDNYKRNPVVGYSHALHGGFFSGPDPDSVIGKSEVFVDGDNLIGRVTFEPAEINPLAEKIFQKVKFGSLRTASVGFVPTGNPVYGKDKEAEGQPNETRYFPGQELLEWSIVNIPSNPSAAKREYADELDLFFKNAVKSLEGKVSEEDLRKMTLSGLMKLMSGDGVDKDIREVEETDKQEKELSIEEIRRQRQLKRIETDLTFHSGFEKRIQEVEDAEKKRLRKYRNEFVWQFNNDFKKVKDDEKQN